MVDVAVLVGGMGLNWEGTGLGKGLHGMIPDGNDGWKMIYVENPLTVSPRRWSAE